MDNCNDKTVFVIDHSPFFGLTCDDPIEFDLSKSRNANIVPLAPVTKSLWTCSLEAAIEYCRIVWDLFPDGKLLRFIASDTTAYNFNSWDPAHQNIAHILNESAQLGPPPSPRSHPMSEHSVVHGLRSAIDALSEPTEQQIALQATLTEGGSQIVNKCRIVCITSTRYNDAMQSLQTLFLKCLLAKNKQITPTDCRLPIHFCHLVIINIYPNNGETLVNSQPPTEMNGILRAEVHSARAGKFLTEKLSNLILGHYDLASTTVTGIPMKEEQNASSSANYDVEIFHHSNAHSDIFKSDMIDVVTVKTRKTMTLKWCTPRGNTQDLYNCMAVYRVTPVDVNSRPSSCLINFLLGGRSVMLEMPKRNGGKMVSHLLSAHGGEIFIHALSTGKSVLEDPPSISEGCGGRVTDYRVADFGSFIQNNKLVPFKSRFKEIEKCGIPLQRMKSRLERQTKYWPITISGAYILNLRQYIDPLPQIMAKEELTSEDVTICLQVFYNLVSLESKHEPLVQPTSGVRGKVPKREDQYKQMWNELEKLVRLHCRSELHKKVLCSLLELRSKDDKTDKGELDGALKALKEMDGMAAKFADGSGIEQSVNRASVIRATTDSPMSPPPAVAKAAPPIIAVRQNRSASSSIYSGPKSVMDMWISKVNTENKSIRDKRPEFYGRQKAGDGIATLYPNLGGSDMDRLNRNDDAMGEQ